MVSRHRLHSESGLCILRVLCFALRGSLTYVQAFESKNTLPARSPAGSDARRWDMGGSFPLLSAALF